MFVKVNMEGYVVGRKIDLGAHESYRSLYRALSKLLRNFLSCTGARMRSGFHPRSVRVIYVEHLMAIYHSLQGVLHIYPLKILKIAYLPLKAYVCLQMLTSFFIEANYINKYKKT